MSTYGFKIGRLLAAFGCRHIDPQRTKPVAYGVPTGRNATDADAREVDWGEFSGERRGDVRSMRVGDECYEIFDAVTFAG
jgi:hypothetical protein